ncbi:outer membrane beta-barrel protein [Flavobacterium sp. '19STA2R22 D10 B1']|uniref:outer membrane beta-barrel protein n=1 Tax=Flavobacterium aerium TaxID=3037261 RepID=UPI00278BB951|nr:outer membrane beta-barrel protein [Flavobacterium sp. '19STA2R22 D10 B1']
MSERKNIDRLFQEKFKDFEVEPSHKVWDNIQAELHPNKKKRKVIPLWFKLSGVAVALLIGFFVTDSVVHFTTIPNDGIVLDNNNETPSSTEKNNSTLPENIIPSNNDNGLVLQESNSNTNSSTENNSLNSTNNNNVVSNNVVASGSKSNSHYSKNKNVSGKNNSESLSNSSSEEDLLNTVQKNRVAQSRTGIASSNTKSNKGSFLSNGLFINPNRDSKDFDFRNSTQKDRSSFNRGDLKKYDTNSAVAASDPNPLEELLKAKEKEKEDQEKFPKTDSKPLSRWQITPNIAAVYFNSTSSGSPIDQQLAKNSKESETSLSYGLGVNYALNNKLSLRSGINKVSVGFNTNDIVFYAGLNNTGVNNVKLSETNAHIVVEPKGSETNTLQANIPGKSNGTLNQRMGYIEVPLELSYKVLDQKFGIQLIGGMSTLFLNENEVSVVSSGLQTDLGEANNLNNVHFSTNIGIGFKYSFLKSFEANFEPMFKYQFNTFSNDVGNFKPYLIGLYTGVSYRF